MRKPRESREFGRVLARAGIDRGAKGRMMNHEPNGEVASPLATPATPRPFPEREHGAGRLARAGWGWSLGATAAVIALFAANLFFFEAAIRARIGPLGAQYAYLAIRLVALVALAHGLTKYGGRNRFQVLSTTFLVGFIDQVFLKGWWVKRDLAAHPENWQGFAPSDAAVFVNLATGYLFFAPVVLILTFLGIESVRFRRQ